MRASVLVLAVLIGAASCASPDHRAIAPTEATREIAAAESLASYIVVLKSKADDPATFAKGRGISPKFVYLHALNGFAAALGAAAASGIANDPHVASVTKAATFSPVGSMGSGSARTATNAKRSAPTGDPTQTNPPWNLDRIDQTRTHLDGKYSYWPSAGTGVRAYIIDSGIRATHVDFAGRIDPGADFVGDGQGTDDCTGHGDEIAGIFGGTTYGVAKLSRFVPLRIWDCVNTPVSTATVLATFDWILANGTKPAVVIIAAEGSYDQPTNDGIANLVANGYVVVVAAGNRLVDACTESPSSAPDALTVAASTPPDGAYPSNFGPCVDFYAPGDAVTSDWFTSDNATFANNGTSPATPHVAGAAALYLAEHPTATPAEVASYLISTATIGALSNMPANTVNRLIRTHNGTP